MENITNKCESEQLDYSARVRRFASQHPYLSFLINQITFWTIASCFMASIIHFHGRMIAELYHFSIEGSFWFPVLIAIVLGISYGLVLGTTDYLLDGRFFRNRSLGTILALKVVIYSVVMLVLYALLCYVLVGLFLKLLGFSNAAVTTDVSWRYFFYIYCIHNFFMIILINFINQVNRKYGSGVLVPLLLGKYRKPHPEERVFMFMDLKSSTTIAEEMGYMLYSRFISDAFMDINNVVSRFKAEIYQYVGDEIVLSWKVNRRLDFNECINFFYAVEEEFQFHEEEYIKKYGQLPLFKIGLHVGIVSAVEIGDIKRDIAYHGDVLNTAARIQSLCNEYDSRILASEDFINYSQLNNDVVKEVVGSIMLRGKNIPVNVYSATKTISN